MGCLLGPETVQFERKMDTALLDNLLYYTIARKAPTASPAYSKLVAVMVLGYKVHFTSCRDSGKLLRLGLQSLIPYFRGSWYNTLPYSRTGNPLLDVNLRSNLHHGSASQQGP